MTRSDKLIDRTLIVLISALAGAPLAVALQLMGF